MAIDIVSCKGPHGATCTLTLILAAGLRHGSAGSRQLRLRAGARKTITVTMNAAARRLLRQDHVLRGVLTITEQTPHGEKQVAKRRLTIRS